MTPEEKLGAIRAKLDELDTEENRYGGGWRGMHFVIQPIRDILNMTEAPTEQEKEQQLQWYRSIAETEPKWYRVTSADPNNKLITGFKGTLREAARISEIADSMNLRLIIWDPDGFPVLGDDAE